ncbi:MAG: hypothetical protein ACLUTZ_07810 [Oliverpabstia sp.]
MEFWIGIIFDTICLAIALFMAINPKGFARGMKYQSVRQTKIFPDRGNHRGDHSGHIPDEPGSDTGIRR